MATTASGNVPAPDRRKVLEWLADESVSGRYLPPGVIAILLHACAHPSLKGDALRNAWTDLERAVRVREYAARERSGDPGQALNQDRARQALLLLTEGRSQDGAPSPADGPPAPLLAELTGERGTGYLFDSSLPAPSRPPA
jgi:hypothetical protein